MSGDVTVLEATVKSMREALEFGSSFLANDVNDGHPVRFDETLMWKKAMSTNPEFGVVKELEELRKENAELRGREEEARWLVSCMATWGTGPYVTFEWIQRRDKWLKVGQP